VVVASGTRRPSLSVGGGRHDYPTDLVGFRTLFHAIHHFRPAMRAILAIGSQLVGLHLSALVAELEAVHGQGKGPTEPPLSLETILGNQREPVLTHGLAGLPHDRLRQLLRHP
jgi:hypothetical protein